MERQTSAAVTGQERDTYLKNLETLHQVLGRDFTTATAAGTTPSAAGLAIRLSRVVRDDETNTTVGFEGPCGLEALLHTIHASWDALEPIEDGGRLVGLTGTLAYLGAHGAPVAVAADEVTGKATLPCRLELAAGGQLVATVGPHPQIMKLLGALEAVDRQVHVAARSLGRNYSLISEGYNPLVSSPLDVSLVPRTRYTLQNAYLGQTGRYGRDFMRCICSTDVLLPLEAERDAIDTYRLAAALSPILTFLTDNVRSFRGSGARRCPRMVRTQILSDTDRSRCGVVPGTFERTMSYERYLEWLQGVCPIALTAPDGSTLSLNKQTTVDVLITRELTEEMAEELLESVYPTVRLTSELEVCAADALRPKTAAAYAVFCKAILTTPLTRDSAAALFEGASERDVEEAARELSRKGWKAICYGRPITELVSALVSLAKGALDASERRLMMELAELWEVHMVPRDAYVTQEIRANRGW